MSCSSCSESIINDVCGCGCSTCQPFTTAPGCHHCPPPPPIPPCATRVCDGVATPVWHPLHPLIPSFRTLYNDVTQTGCDEGTSDQQLASILVASEPVFSTCQFPGEQYYQALMLHTAALLEYEQDIAQWRAARNAMMMLGKNFNSPKPTLEDGVYGQMLAELIRSHPNGRFSLSV